MKSLISADPSEVGADARTVINALFERPWRIVHIAGHGALPEKGKPGGVVLSNGSFLGPDEIRNMRVVPELVFVNCCHLASGDANQLLNLRLRPRQLCVGRRGSVDRHRRALRNRRRMGRGRRRGQYLRGRVLPVTAAQAIGSSTPSARRAKRPTDRVRNRTRGRHTSATATPTGSSAARQPTPISSRRPAVDEFSSVASVTSLKLALERIIVGTKFQGIDPVDQRNRLQQLEKKFGQGWGKSGSVAELFGEAFVEVGAVESGMHWYQRAVTAPDGRASMKAAEQLANVRGRLGWEIVDKAQRHRDEMKERLDSTPKTPKARAAARRALADAEKRLRESSGTARKLIRDSLGVLKSWGQWKQRWSVKVSWVGPQAPGTHRRGGRDAKTSRAGSPADESLLSARLGRRP